MVHVIEFLFRYLIRFTIGTIIFGCLIVLSLIFWKEKYMDIINQIDDLILNEK
jgi:lipopolysaccharide export LptBFGC system permease protein LptF